jgi:hypothetical protein
MPTMLQRVRPRRSGVMTVLAALLLVTACVSCERTVLPPNFKKKQFRTLAVGCTLEQAMRSLGPPLRVIKYSSDPKTMPLEGGRLYEEVPLVQLSAAAKNPNTYLILNYSLQENARKDYHRYDLMVQEGKVVRKWDEAVWE